MARFTDHEKAEIVTLLAHYVNPERIVELFQTRGIETDFRQIAGYDPTKAYFEAGAKWRELFDAAREKYVQDLSAIPSTHKAFRINLLEEAALEARRKGEHGAMATLLKQIAEECGGVLTNRRRVDVNHTDVASLSDDDRRAALARVFNQALAEDPEAPQRPAGATVQ